MIDTPRLVLQHLVPDDVGLEYVAWLNNPKVNRFLEIRHAPMQTVQSVREFVASCADNPEIALFGAFLRDGNTHIGNIKLGPINRRYGTADVGLIVGAPSARGLGLGPEMIEGVMGYAFGTLGIRKLTAGCYEENLASLRSFMKCGFVVEGFRPGEVVLDGAPQGVFLMGYLSQVADV